jgi:adenylate cyclase
MLSQQEISALLPAYLPIDRYLSILSDITLPDYTEGTALFADISGFTHLTEILLGEYGPGRGAEELALHLNRVYTALIAQIHEFGGSVLYFSGDAITCWFDNHWDSSTTPDQNPTEIKNEVMLRAVASALQLQAVMLEVGDIATEDNQILTRLHLKVSLAAGKVRRFIVGDPNIQLLDTITGTLLDRLAVAEFLAKPGEVILASEIVRALGSHLKLGEWRNAPSGYDIFATLNGITGNVATKSWENENFYTVEHSRQNNPEILDKLNCWLLGTVAQRLNTPQIVDLLTELRPATAFFMSFEGIDYENDPIAESKLDKLVREVQQILVEYGGSLLQLTTGDKGSYLYAAFGAPVAYQNDTIRAVQAGLYMLSYFHNSPIKIKVGISNGIMRVGAYGSPQRYTYGVLGDEVNVAARLMQIAQPGQLLISDRVYSEVNRLFQCENLPLIRIKGKSVTTSIFRVVKQKKITSVLSFGVSNTSYNSSLIGRQAELEQVVEKLSKIAQTKQGYIIGIVGEAGIGKTSFLATIAQRMKGDWNIYVSTCQPYSLNMPYYIWQTIFQAIFDTTNIFELLEKNQVVEELVKKLYPEYLPRLPLLNPVLGTSFSDVAAWTQNLDPKLRKNLLESFLLHVIHRHSQNKPLLLILEDCNWLDSLSLELVEACNSLLIRNNDAPIALLLSYRPSEGNSDKGKTAHFHQLGAFQEVKLRELNDTEANSLIKSKLQGSAIYNGVEISDRWLS